MVFSYFGAGFGSISEMAECRLCKPSPLSIQKSGLRERQGPYIARINSEMRVGQLALIRGLAIFARNSNRRALYVQTLEMFATYCYQAI